MSTNKRSGSCSKPDLLGAPIPSATSPSATGTHFASGDWVLLFLAAAIWGASFLFIDIGLDRFQPGVIVTARILFGFLALGAIADARRPLPRSTRPAVFALAVVWLAFPLTMFPIAEQWIDSSLAGMLNSTVPLFAAVIGAMWFAQRPTRLLVVGLVVGFGGVVVLSLPSLTTGSTEALGVSLCVLATISYGVASNLTVRLSRYGTLAVLWNAQRYALLLTLPYALVGLPKSSFGWPQLSAMVALGALGTGVAFWAAGTLMARVGATRGAMITYFAPLVAIVLGVAFRDDNIHPQTLVGTALVLAGAWISSRGRAVSRDTSVPTEGPTSAAGGR